MRLLLPQILAIMFITKDKTMAVGKTICSKGFTARPTRKPSTDKQAQLVMQEQSVQNWGKTSQVTEREG